MTSYKHYTQMERILLSAMHRKGFTQAEIGRALGRSQSSVSRELKRNSDNDGTYHAGRAGHRSRTRRDGANDALKRIENDPWLELYINQKLRKYWSPEQVAGRLRQEHDAVVCHETIYQYILKSRPELKKYLRCRKGKYRRRYGTKIREKQREKSKKKRIDTRPLIVETRDRLGDWEGDTVVGKRGTGSLLTHVERLSGYTMIDYVERALADVVKEKTICRFNRLPQSKRKSLTYDNGSEFDQHELIELETKISIYFAYPYHSWERGTNENTNGLIRQFFPKKTSFATITQKDTRRVELILNTRPRKRLGYLTPIEVFKRNMHLT